MMTNKYMQVIAQSALFARIPEDSLHRMLACFHGAEHAYNKGDIIFRAGDRVRQIGMILDGNLDTIQEDFWGNQVLLGRIGPGQTFAEAYVLAQADAFPFTVFSVRESVVLLLDYHRILHVCPERCAHHERLIENLLSIVAKKSILLLWQIEHVTKRTTREKLLAFLSSQANQAGSSRFTIPYNRQGLANYLAVDRSAMSHELSKMQKEGILSYEKNAFELHGG